MVKPKPNLFFFLLHFEGKIDLKEQEEVILFNLKFLFTCFPWMNSLSTKDLLLFYDGNYLVRRVYLTRYNRNK